MEKPVKAIVVEVVIQHQGSDPCTGKVDPTTRETDIS